MSAASTAIPVKEKVTKEVQGKAFDRELFGRVFAFAKPYRTVFRVTVLLTGSSVLWEWCGPFFWVGWWMWLHPTTINYSLSPMVPIGMPAASLGWPKWFAI
ncbi:MAG: hypothetical protein IPF64_08315 [Flavobacteriales bacterium]|nr:hypothetical protein [Flavobacteriales bacterium]